MSTSKRAIAWVSRQSGRRRSAAEDDRFLRQIAALCDRSPVVPLIGAATLSSRRTWTTWPRA